MAFNIKTFKSDSRFYLIEVEPIDKNAIISSNQIEQLVKYNFQKFFGSEGIKNVKIEVNEFKNKQFIISTDEKNCVALRAAISLAIPNFSNISRINILSESSFLQPIVHDSRLFFSPLID